MRTGLLPFVRAFTGAADFDPEGNAHLIFASTMWELGGAQPIYARVEPATSSA